jgi:hypothetical protein
VVERLLGLLLIISSNPQYVAKVAFFAVGALIVTLIVTSMVHQDRKIAALKAQANLPITAVVVKAGTGMKTGLEFRVTDSKQIEAFKIALQTVKDPYTNRSGSYPIELIIKGPDGSKFAVTGSGGYVNFSIESTDPMAFGCSLDSKHPSDLRCTFQLSFGSAGQFRTKGLHAWIRNLGP